jgi:hypothetical protein
MVALRSDETKSMTTREEEGFMKCNVEDTELNVGSDTAAIKRKRLPMVYWVFGRLPLKFGRKSQAENYVRLQQSSAATGCHGLA